MRKIFLTALVFGGAAMPAIAQEPKVDCGKAETQMEMTYCAEQDLVAADKALNAQYQATRKVAKKRDADSEPDANKADEFLVKAQRAWVAYRDAQCDSWGYQAHGGSMEPQLIYDCQADLTRKRTAELKALSENM